LVSGENEQQSAYNLKFYAKSNHIIYQENEIIITFIASKK
jgi:hypothetical protein